MLEADGAVSGIGINDVMLEPLPPESPVDRKVATIHAYVDDEYVGEFTGSGVAVATPTGSTAVAFSAGGPVHYPNANSSLQLTPLHTHNAGVRPVIVDSETTITLIPESEIAVAIDGGRTHATIGEGDEVTVTGADQRANIVRTEYDESFFDAMSGKLGWGVRGVDEPGPREH
jgi:myo-inositol-1(or 4)-monophosphatase